MQKTIYFLVSFLIVLFLIGTPQQPLPPNSQNGTYENETPMESLQDSRYSVTSEDMVNPLAKRETVFYGMADDPSVRNIVGYADYILCSHALWSSGSTIRDNVRYLSDHGVKVILVSGWWDVFPFTGAGINGWEDMHWENVVYGMNATESVKYRIRQMMDEIGSEYVWGISIGEEEPVGDQSFPWAFITWYMNLFYDWIHDEYPGVNVLQWIQPVPFYLQQAHNLKADAIIYDNYNQNYTEIAGIASQLKTAYPTTPLLFMISSVEHTDPWFTCHPPTYTKRAVAAIAPYADIIGFWLTDDYGNEGWEVEHEGYKLAQRICNQIHIMDANTIYGNTEWFECGFGNDTVTDSLDNWYRSYWKDQPPDTDLQIETSLDNQVGDYSINLTCTDFGTHSFWWQYLGHDYGFPDWPGIPNSHPINMTDASRITFWVKGFGWENHPSAKATIYIEESNYPLGYPGNLTLPEITSYLADGQWHRVTIDLPLPPSYYYNWEGYCSQLRIEVDYSESVVSNMVSILFDGWVVESFDTGKAHGLSSTSDYVAVNNGTLYIGGNAYFESHFPQANAWYYQYSGTGDIEMLLNGTWTSPPDEGIPCRWNVSAIRLSNGSFEWFKVNAIPPIVDILYPLENSLLSGHIEVQVNATDESGIDRVEFSVDDVHLHVDTTYPYTFTWDTTTLLDGVHLLNVTAWSEDLKSNFHDIEVTIDNTQPSLTISSPEEAEVVTGYVSISVLTNDLSGIASVEFFSDGLSLFTDYAFPYEYTWDTLGVSDGVHNLTCQVMDLTGNVRTESRLVTVDNSGPVLSIHSVSVWGSSGQITVNTSDASGVARVEFYFEYVLQEVDYSYPYEWVWSGLLLPDGNYTLTVISYDIFNHSSTVFSDVEIDNTLPSLSISWTPPETDVSDIVSFNAIASDNSGIAYVEFYLDGALQNTDYAAPYTWIWDTTLVSDGTHTVEVVAIDNMGNCQTIVAILNVDNTGPVIVVNTPANQTILSGPSAISVLVTVQDTSSIDTVLLSYYSGSSWISIEMTPSGSYFEATTPVFPIDTEVLLRIYADDTLGNSKWSLTYTCNIVDLTSPSVIIEVTPSTPVVSSTIQIDVSVTDESSISMVVIYIDGTPMVWLSSAPYSWFWDTTVQVDGSHTIRAWANDTMDNSGFTETSITTDNSGPQVVINSPSDASIFGGPYSISVLATALDSAGIDTVILSYSTGIAWTNVTMVISGDKYEGTIPNITPGETVDVRIYANDTLGNGAWSTTFTYYIVDENVPSLTVILSPDSPIYSGSVYIGVTASDLSGISMVIFYIDDVQIATDVSAPFEFLLDTNSLTDDIHTLRVWTNDTWDNSNFEEILIITDNSGPLIVINSPLDESIFGGPCSISVLATALDDAGIDTMLLSFDTGIGWTDISMVINGNQFEGIITNLQPGDTIDVRIWTNDTLGNEAWSMIYTYYVIDETPPSLSFTLTPDNSVYNGYVFIEATATDLSGISMVIFYIDDVPIASDEVTPYEYLFDTRVLGDGPHTVQVWTNDTWNNSNYLEVSIQIDNTGPASVINSPVNLAPIEGPVAISVLGTVQDEHGVDSIILGYFLEGVWTNISMMPSGFQYNGLLPVLQPGATVQLQIYANDSLGNWAVSSISTIYIVDTISPSISILLSPNWSLLADSVEVLASVTDVSTISTVVIYVDGFPITTLHAAPYHYLLDTSSIADGLHTLQVWANDTWNNSNYAELSFETDNSAPVISVTAPVNGTVYDAPSRVNVEASISDSHSLSQVLVSYTTGGSWVIEPMVLYGSKYIWNSTLLMSGAVIKFIIFANDTVGNERITELYECSVMDSSGPVIGEPSLSPKAPTSFDPVTVSVSVSDHSGVGTSVLSYCVDSGPWINITMKLNSVYWATLPAMPTGSVIGYRIYVNDTLGHWSSSPIYGYTVVPFDVLPPAIVDSSWTPITPDDSQTVSVSINATDPSGVTVVILSYHDSSTWHNTTMTLVSGQHVADVPSLSFGTIVTLKVYACDGQGNWGVTPLGSYTVASSDLDGPEVLLLTWTPSDPTEEDSVEVYAELSDYSGLHNVLLCYGHGAIFANVTMTFNGTGYVATIGARPIGTQVSLCIYSCDSRDNWAEGDWTMYIVKASDSTPPVISDVVWSPTEPFSNEFIRVNATISDENSINLVLLSYFDGSTWRNLTMMQISSGPNRFVVQIPAIGVAGTIQIWVLAQDSKGNWGFTELMTIEVHEVPPTTTPPTTTVPTTTPITIPPPDPLILGLAVVGLPVGVVVGFLLSLILKRRSGGK